MSDNSAFDSLTQHQLDDLHNSGISDDMARRAGIYCEKDYPKLTSMLGMMYPATSGPAMIFPYRNKEGEAILLRIKPEKPIEYKDKKTGKVKTIRYASPKRSKNRVYYPPGVREYIANGDKEIVITEGEKKSLKAAQEDFCCIGLGGVWNWKNKDSDALIPPTPRHLIEATKGWGKDLICTIAILWLLAFASRSVRIQIGAYDQDQAGESKLITKQILASDAQLNQLLAHVIEVQRDRIVAHANTAGRSESVCEILTTDASGSQRSDQIGFDIDDAEREQQIIEQQNQTRKDAVRQREAQQIEAMRQADAMATPMEKWKRENDKFAFDREKQMMQSSVTAFGPAGMGAVYAGSTMQDMREGGIHMQANQDVQKISTEGTAAAKAILEVLTGLREELTRFKVEVQSGQTE